MLGGHGAPVWDLDQYEFLDHECPDTVNPSLWRQAGKKGRAAKHGVVLAVSAVVLSGAVYGLHRYQVRRNAGVFLEQARKAEEDAKKKELAGDIKASWGDQMRSYVLHPYQMVKDLRTEYEVGNPAAVFDGEIDGFIEAGIRWRRRQALEAAQN